MQRVSTPFYWLARFVPAAFFVALFFGLAALLALPGSAAAVTCSPTVTVANSSDSGTGSLRQALVDVCDNGAINFAASFGSGGPYTITLTSGELGIAKNVTITGPGPDLLAVSGGGASRVFNISSGKNVAISGLTIRDGYNGSGNGGGINNAGTLTLTNSALLDNSVGSGSRGGALANGGQATVVNSIVAGNRSPDRGGGIYTSGSGLLSITNTTFYSNTGDNGGALSASYGYAAVTNSTFSGNTATSSGAAIRTSMGAITLTNTILEGSLNRSNCAITPLTDAGGNISDDNSCGFTAATSRNTTDPLLAPLADYGGDTQTMGLLPGSPAIDFGVPAACPEDDQRGLLRMSGSCDSGAFESRGFVLSVAGGSPQAATIYSAFAEPLSVTVGSNFGEPVGPGGVITFTPPASGAGLTVVAPFTRTTDTDGLAASGIITANSIGGSYGVTATAGSANVNIQGGGGGSTEAIFDLTNECLANATVTDDGDDGAGTLRQAMLLLCAGGTIDFDAGLTSSGPATITLTSGQLGVTKDMTITGPGPDLLAVSGNDASRVFMVNDGVSATISGLTLRDGNSDDDNGGGIRNDGMLTVTNSALVANNGGGILGGGGIYNDFNAVLTVTDSIFHDNIAPNGGGIFSMFGALTVVNSTFYSNTASSSGGGVGISSNDLAMTNSTFSANSAGSGANIFATNATVTLTNTLAEKPLGGGNCSHANTSLTDGGGNIEDGTSCGFTAPTSLSSTDAKLSALGNYGGDTQTVALLPGSPAIDFGVANGCPAADQRGVARPQGLACDSGAFESRGFNLAIAGGSPQTATIYGAFAEPLSVTVSSAYTEPVGPGGVITFTPPSSGAGLSAVTPFTASTDAGGVAASGVITANAVIGSYGVTATARGEGFDINAFNGAPAAVVFDLTNQCNATDTVTNTGDDGGGSLRQAMLTLCPGGSIDFAAGLTSSGAATITLTSGELSVTKDMTITGPGPDLLAVSGGDTQRVFNVGAGVHATLDGLAIRDGNAGSNTGGGIENSGVLTVTNSAIVENAGSMGAGIYAVGPLTVTNSFIGDNSASSDGGGVASYNSTLAVVNSTFTGNSVNGGGGGGIFVFFSTAAVTNSTFVANSALYGSGVHVDSGSLEVANSVLSGSAASSNCSNAGGSLDDGGGNLEDRNDCGFSAANGSYANTNPLLGELIFSVNTWLFPLLPGSPAIDFGFLANCPEDDQRGILRLAGSSCDSGAFESRGFNLAIAGGSPQTATIYSAFAEPLTVTVSSAASEPVGPGGVITFTPPSSGPGLSTVAPFTVSTDAAGLAASRVITANGIDGGYGVTATVGSANISAGGGGGGAAQVVFDLTNTCNATDTVTNTDDDGDGSLRQAMLLLCAGGVIDFAPALTASGPNTITLTSGELDVDRAMTITGPGAERLAVSGGGESGVFLVRSKATDVTISGLTIRDGDDEDGGGIYNAGVLTVTESIFTGNNAAGDGGAILNFDTLAVLNSTFTNNSAEGDGGAIYVDEADATVTNSTFAGNSAEGYGGGIFTDESTLAVTNSTFLSNIAYDGGAINNDYSTLTVVNSTFIVNDAEYGGGIYSFEATTTVTNSTFAGNSAEEDGGGVYVENGSLTLANTILELSGDAGNCFNNGGSLTDGGGNLEDGTTCGFSAANDSRSSVNPLLSIVGDYGGATQTMAPLPGSPAIDFGLASACPAEDQRGFARPQGLACDSGAVESHDFTLAIASGSPQTTTIYGAFAQTLAVTVSNAYSEPVGPGGVITFTPPSSGPGLNVTNPFTVATDAAGAAASGVITANSVVGSYGVTATVGAERIAPVSSICNGGCGATEVTFSLANEPITPDIALDSDLNPSYFSQPVLLTAIVTTSVPGAGAPTGVVTFTEGAEVLGTDSLDGSGLATLLVYNLAVGDHTMTAAYGGDGGFNANTADAITQTVEPAPTTTDLQIKPNPALYGENVTFGVQVLANLPGLTALVRTPSPSGQLAITDTTGTIDLTGWVVDGKAVVSGGIIPAGQYTVYATYEGNDSFTASTSQPATLVVNKHTTNTELESSDNPAYVDGPLRFTVDVGEMLPDAVRLLMLSGPTGAVLITDTSGAINLGGSLVDGTVELAAPALAEGTYTVTAAYLGDERFAPSASTALVQVVERRATTVTLSLAPNLADVGEEVVFTATVSEQLTDQSIAGAGPRMSGHVVFSYGGVEFGRATVANGVATLRSSLLPVGVHSIVAAYLGDRAFVGSTSQPQMLVVGKAPTVTGLESSDNPAYVDGPLRFTVAVGEMLPGMANLLGLSGPAGAVLITDTSGAINLGGSLVNGTVELAAPALAEGTYTVTAAYLGDERFAPSVSTALVQIVQRHATTTTLSVAPNPANQGDEVTFTATVSEQRIAGAGPRMSGHVVFSYGGVEFGRASVTNGVATLRSSLLPVGVHSIAAEYLGDSAFAGSTSQPQTLEIDKFATRTTLASSDNPAYVDGPLRFTVDVGEVLPDAVRLLGLSEPTGAVLITDTSGAINLGGSLVNGTVELAAPALAEGTYTVTAAYLGDERFAPSVSKALVQVVERRATTVTLSLAPNLADVGEEVVFTATVSEQRIAGAGPRMSGHVVFTYGGVEFGRATVANGVATLRSSLLPVGVHSIAAEYLGDRAFVGSTSQPQMLVVGKAPTVTGLASNSNPAYVDAPLRFTVAVGEMLPGMANLLGLSGPAGAVVITDTSGAINLGGSLVNGTVELAAPALAEGTYTVTAAYLGDERFAPSVSTALVQIVQRHATTTTLSVAPGTAKVGETVQFTATVSTVGVTALTAGGPSGSVAFFANGAPLGSANLAGGQALLSAPASIAGVFTVTAVYGGDSVYAASTAAPATLTVARRSTGTALSVAPNPSRQGEMVRFTATVAEQVQAAVAESVAPQPSGQVIFRSNGAEIGRASLSGGSASMTASSLPVGSHAITAEYVGDSTFAPSSGGPATLVVQPMPLAVNDAAGAQGQGVSINVTANDRDPAGGGLTIISVTAPGHGSATITPGGPNVLYTPAAGFAGIDNFTYVIEDANGNRDDALVAVVVTHVPEGQGKPQVQAANPGVDSSGIFTTPVVTMTMQAPAGFFTSTLAEKDILFVSFTPVITPSQETNSPPANLKFGNLEFNLSLFLNDQRLEGQAFAAPLVLTINYDPSLMSGLNAETLGLWYWNGTAWSTDGIAILSNDVANHTVTISISHFSQLAFFAAAPTGLDPGEEPQRPYNLYLPAMGK